VIAVLNLGGLGRAGYAANGYPASATIYRRER